MRSISRIRTTAANVLATLALAIVAPLADAETFDVRDPDELVRALAAAKPGDTVRLAPGTYRGGILRRELRGEPKRPIVIESRDPKRPAVLSGGSTGLHLSDPAHVIIRNITIEKAGGNGLNIDDGSSFETPARDITLYGLVVRDIGPKGNRDGIKLSGVVDFRVEHCRVERWGSGGSGIDMVGCKRGLIVSSTFVHDSRTAAAANGIQAKGGSRDITVRRCRFEDAGGRAVNIGGSTGFAYFRPRPQGFEAKDIVVEDSVFVGSTAPICFVGVDGAIVRHNTIYRPRRWVARILQETKREDFVPSRRGRFESNIVAFRSDELSVAVNIGGDTAPKTFAFSENVWYCLDRPERSEALLRGLPVKEHGGKYGVDPRFVDASAGRLELRDESSVRGAGVRSAKD